MDAAKRSEKVSQRLPQAFNRVDVDFTNAVAIIIARPLFFAMTDRRVTPPQAVIAWPLVAVASRALGGELLNVPMQGRFRRSLANTQAALATAASDSPDYRQMVILVRAMTALFIGSTTRRISGVAMLFAFFPPPSETSRRFQSGGLSRASHRAAGSRSLAGGVATCERFDEIIRVLQPRPENFRLYRRRARARLLVAGASCCPKRVCCGTS